MLALLASQHQEKNKTHQSIFLLQNLQQIQAEVLVYCVIGQLLLLLLHVLIIIIIIFLFIIIIVLIISLFI